MRRIGLALGALALLFAAGCVTTTETACNVGDESRALASIQTTLKATTTQEAYNAALRTAYPDLSALYGRTSVGVAGVAPADQIVCFVIAAEAAEMQSFLPAADRIEVAPPNSEPPFQLAKAAADAALRLCPAGEAARCAVATMISGAAVSNDAYNDISATAANETSTDTVAAWTAADSRIDTFGTSSRGWMELVVQATAAEAMTSDDAMGYVKPLACGVLADGGALRSRTTAQENFDAAEAFAESYQVAMNEVAEELDLDLPAAAAEICETTPESQSCKDAGAGAVLAMCTDYWGFSGN
jgi:hypothetical protein